MKITQTDFLKVYKAYAYLKNYLKDINIDYVKQIYTKLENLTIFINDFRK